MPPRHDRVGSFFDGVKRNRREIVGPEGVVLELDVANNGERLTAFIIDFLFWVLATALLFFILLLLLRQHLDAMVGVTIILFLAFMLRNFYFIYFELATRGSTPGKRFFGLKVIDRMGNPLLPGAIVARNLTREVEIFLPLGLFMSLPAAGHGGNNWVNLTYLGWITLLSALPFFNKDHLRAGDVIAGTMVISVPKRRLLADLVDTRATYVFQRNHLETYGAFELQVLEELLRKRPSLETTRTRRDVCDKIRAKIGYEPNVPNHAVDSFLKDFYVTQRAHLEREQLFGKYRKDKNQPLQK